MSGDLILRAVLEKALLEKLTSLHAETRAELASTLKVTERRPVEFRGVEVGTVSKKRGAKSARVADVDELLRWAQANREDEVEEVVTYRVRPATMKAWLAELKSGGSVVSEATGEILHDLPGVTVNEGSPTLEIALERTDEAGDLFAELLNAARPLELEEPTPGGA